MKIIAVGIGQCGCNIADEFYGINNYAKSFLGHGTEILIDAFAVNTDETDLSSLRRIPTDKHHRMIVGMSRTHGHGVGKKNLDGAKIMSEAYPGIVDSMIDSKRFHETDAVIVIASGAGGTGSGGIGLLVKGLKERIMKPVYGVVVLPFSYEEKGDTSYAVTNTARSLKTVNQYADAVFLLDNERFARTDIGLNRNLGNINKEMVQNFYDLFCAGEEQRIKNIGSKVMDAGDIRQTLSGICAIGGGQVNLSTFLLPRSRSNYHEAAKESMFAFGAMEKAINNLGLKVNIEDSMKILALVSAPKDTITLSVLGDISNYLQEKSPKAVVRMGDYPRGGKEISVTLILSQLTSVARMENLFLRAALLLKNQEETERETAEKIKVMLHTSANIPTLDI